LKLLHAALDGELSPEEDADVQEMLEDPGVQEYFDTCLKVRNLVKQHAPVKAPVDLKARVLKDIKSEAELAPVHQLPTASWWAPMIGVAAAIVLVVAITFGPEFGDTTPQGPSEVAHTVSDKPIADSIDDEAAPEPTADPALVLDRTEELDGEDGRESLEELSENEKHNFGRGDAGKKTEDGVNRELSEEDKLAKALNEVKKSTEPQDRKSRNTDTPNAKKQRGYHEGSGMGKAGRAPSGNRVNKAKSAERDEDAERNRVADSNEKNEGLKGGSDDAESEESEQEAIGTGGGGSGAAEERTKESKRSWGEKESTPAKEGKAKTKKGERRAGSETPGEAGPDLEDEPKSDAKDEAAPKPENSDNGPTPPSPEPPTDEDPEAEPAEQVDPAEAPADKVARRQNQEQVIEIASPEGKELAAQADLLWVSGIYGTAAIDSEDESEVEAITVEVAPDQLPKLIEALKKLSKKQAYGEVEVEQPKQPAAGGAVKVVIRIK
jgi:hypothetical protein